MRPLPLAPAGRDLRQCVHLAIRVDRAAARFRPQYTVVVFFFGFDGLAPPQEHITLTRKR